MKSILAFILILIFPVSVLAQKPDCQKFKNGVFIYIDPIAPDYEIKITRNDSIQTEYNSFFGGTVSSKVIWKTECVYELIYEKFEGFLLSMDKNIGKSITCRILETNGNESYKVHAKSDKKDPGRIFTIKRAINSQ